MSGIGTSEPHGEAHGSTSAITGRLSNGTVLFASGSNARGQLGINSQDDSHVLSQCVFSSSTGVSSLLPPNAQISQLVSGANHTLLALTRNGRLGVELWGSGDGSKGQLGPAYSTRPDTLTFCPLELSLDEYGCTGYHPRLVAAAWETSFVVISCENKSDIVLSMGADDWGDLGVGGHKNIVNVVKFDHLVDGFGTPADMNRLLVKSIVAGPHHVVVHFQVTSSNGHTEELLAGWGSARHGQLGPTCQNVKAVSRVSLPKRIDMDARVHTLSSAALGNQHTVLLRSSDHVSVLGSNRKGQLQGLETLKNVRDIACTWNGTYVLVDGLGLLSTGSNEKGQLGRPTQADDSPRPVQFPAAEMHERVKSLKCGSEHVLCIMGDEAEDEVWGWGWNEHGNLGLGTTEDVSVPMKIWPCGADFMDVGLGNGRRHVSGIWAGCGTSWIAVEF